MLSEYELTEDEIRDEISYDGAGDGGIDFFYKTDDDPARVFVMQVKDHASFPKVEQREALSKMREQIEYLRDKPTSAGLNEAQKNRRDVLRANRNAFIEYFLVITGAAKATLEATDLSADWNAGDDFTWAVVDREILSDLIYKEQNPANPSVTISWPAERMLEISDGGSELVIHGYIDAAQYADATMKHKTDIFRLNPRLFLSTSTGYHKGMYDTLHSPEESKKFHLFNNGITAVANSFEITRKADGSAEVLCEDFQVVNGCQTTETLWRWRKDHAQGSEVPSVLVPLRIVQTADVGLAEAISRTNNSQSAITSADLIANSTRQKLISSWLQGLPNNKFVYEARRGTWGKMTKPQQEAYKISDYPRATAGKQYRKISIRELAQMLLAIHGKPEQAKEQITGWFASNEKQEQLFGRAESPHQIALIAELTRVLAKPANWVPEAKLTDVEYLKYANLGRFYVAHLVYEYLKSDGSPTFADEIAYLSAAKSQEIRNDIFKTLPKVAHAAVTTLMFTEPEGGDGIRGLLRKSMYRSRIQTKFLETLELQATL